jgi:hypothetical protein
MVKNKNSIFLFQVNDYLSSNTGSNLNFDRQLVETVAQTARDVSVLCGGFLFVLVSDKFYFFDDE